MVREIRTVYFPAEEASFEEPCIDLAIPRTRKMPAKCVCMIERSNGRHHVNNGLCSEPRNGGTPIVLKLICYTAHSWP